MRGFFVKYLQSVVKHQKEKWEKSRKPYPIVFKITGFLFLAGAAPFLWFAGKVRLVGGANASMAGAILILAAMVQIAVGIFVAKYLPGFMAEIVQQVFELLERFVK